MICIISREEGFKQKINEVAMVERKKSLYLKGIYLTVKLLVCYFVIVFKNIQMPEQRQKILV